MRLSLDELSGEISGIPLVESDKRMYKIMGENRDGVGSVEIEIMARRGVCKGEGQYREVEVVSVYCSGNGLYIGYEKKRCVLGEEDGGQQNVCGSECDNTADSDWNDVDDDSVVDEEEKEE